MSVNRGGQAEDGRILHAMVVDRLEGRHAILVSDDGDQVQWPVEKLPPGAEPGIVVKVEMWVDSVETQERRRRVQGLLDDLFKTSA